MRIHFPSFSQKRWIGTLVIHACLVITLGFFFFGSGLKGNVAQVSAHAAVSSSSPALAHIAVSNSSQQPAKGQKNPFPYGSCTWWAAQRYHQMTGIYVPWQTQANAWQWTARAWQFHWHVSSTPTRGAIIDLQPWVQGAYGFGHVAVVEQVLGNGRVIASNMSWGANPWRVVNVQFSPGSGVTFLSF